MPDPKDLSQLLKEGLIKKGNDESLHINKLPVGIGPLDELLGGGLPLGRCLELYGPESTGKTLLAQYAIAAVQKSPYPLCLYMDMENSYDESWWRLSGVDTDQLLVSKPVTAEAAIDIMRAMLHTEKDLGLIFVDSVAAMIPKPEMDPDKSSEDTRQPGLQAKVITFMYHQIVPLLDNRVVFMTSNQMRETIGMGSDLDSLPGGRAQRHYSHIILKTRRDSWLKDKNQKVYGYNMEITSRKNKLSSIPDGSSITLPVLASSQIDMLTTLLEDAINKQVITRKGPYYHWATQGFLGMDKLRNFFLDSDQEMRALEEAVTIA